MKFLPLFLLFPILLQAQITRRPIDYTEDTTPASDDVVLLDNAITGVRKASIQTLSTVFGTLVSVDSFGADGTDAIDDTLAIQNALNSATNVAGLYFPGGTYRINSTLSVTNNVLLLGSATILETTQLAPMIEVTAANVTIDSLALQGSEVAANWSTNTSTIRDRAAVEVRAQRFTARNVYITGKSTGFYFESTAGLGDYGKIQSCWLTGIGDLTTSQVNYVYSAGIYFYGAEKLTVSDTSFTGFGHAVRGENLVGYDAYHTYTGNILDAQLSGSFWLRNVDNISISNNTTDNYAGSTTALILDGCDYVRLTGNNFDNSNRSINILGTTSNLDVVGNRLADIVYGGIANVANHSFYANTINTIAFDNLGSSGTYADVAFVGNSIAFAVPSVDPDNVYISASALDPSEDKTGIKTKVPTAALDVNDDTVRLRTSSVVSKSTAGEVGDIRWGALGLTVNSSTNVVEFAPFDSAKGIFDVRQYGAIPDDGINDAVAIQAAIDAVEIAGGVLYFPAGEYGITTELELLSTSDVIVRGNQATIKAVGDMPGLTYMFQFDAANCVIEGLIFDGDNRANRGVRLGDGLTNVTIRDCVVKNIAALGGELYNSQGIDIGGTTIANITIENCTIDGVAGLAGRVSSGISGGSSGYAQDITINGCTIKNITCGDSGANDADGINLNYSTAPDDDLIIRITNNYFENCAKRCIKLLSPKCVVSGNFGQVINTSTTIAPFSPISIYGSDMTVIGNYFWTEGTLLNRWDQGFSFSSLTGFQGSRARIIGNTIINSASATIGSPTQTTAAVYLEGFDSSDDILIQGNYFENFYRGLRMGDAADIWNRVQFVNNTFKGILDDAVYLPGTLNDCTFRDNYFATTTPNPALDVSGTYNNVVWSKNKVVANSASALWSTGANFRFDGDVFNVLDFNATADGTTDDTAAIQEAIDAAASVGGTVFFPEGLYVVSSGPLYIYDNVNLEGIKGYEESNTGFNRGSAIQFSTTAETQLQRFNSINSTAVVIGVDPSDVSLNQTSSAGAASTWRGYMRNLEWRFIFTHSAENLFYGPSAEHVTIENCKFLSSGQGDRNVFKIASNQYAATSGQVARNIVIRDCRIDANHKTGGSGSVGGEGISISATGTFRSGTNIVQSAFAQHITIENNHITDTGDDPIAIHGGWDYYILNNKIETYDGRIYATDSRNFTIQNNTVEYKADVDGYWATVAQGIQIEPENATYPIHCADFRLFGNTVIYPVASTNTTPMNYGFRLRGVRRGLIHDNVILNNETDITHNLAFTIESWTNANYQDDEGTFSGTTAFPYELDVRGNRAMGAAAEDVGFTVNALKVTPDAGQARQSFFRSNATGKGYTLLGTSGDAVFEDGFVVTDFGAIGNGTTDDTEAIQAAIDAAEAGGGTVYFPAGTYNISADIELGASELRIVGEGRKSVIRQITAGQSAFANVTGTRLYRITIKDLKFTTTAGVNAATAIDFTHVSDSFIQDVYVTRDGGAGSGYNKGIYIGSTAAVGGAFRNTIQNCVIITSDTATDRYAVHLNGDVNYGGNSTRIIGGEFRGETSIGVYIDEGDQVTISQAVFEGSQSPAVYIDGNEATITGNRFENTTGAGVGITLDAAYSTIIGNLFSPSLTTFVNNTGSANFQQNIRELRHESTEPDGDATPNVVGQRVLIVNDTAPNTITDFDGPIYRGQLLAVFNRSANTTFAHNSNIKLLGETNYTPPIRSLTEFYCDGAVWYEIGRRNLKDVSVIGDANATLTGGTSNKFQWYNTVLTTNRTITLTGVNDGDEFFIKTDGIGGTYTVDVGGLKTLADDQWAHVVYTGASWQLFGFGSL